MNLRYSKIYSIVLWLFFSQEVWAGQLAVIVHPDNTNQLSKAEISRIYLGKTKFFPNGSKAEPINQSVKSELKMIFDKSVLEKSASQINAYWARLLFTGKGKPPRTFNSDQAIINYVANNENAIGYINSDSVDLKVKVITMFNR